MLPVILVLNGIGYVMIELLAPNYSGNQVAWTIIGVVLYAVTLLVIRRSRDLERYRYLLGLLAFILLILPLMPKISGVPTNEANPNDAGVKLWIHFGNTVSFQPVEIAKLLLVIFFASYFVEKRELLTLPTRRLGNHLVPDLRSFGPIAFAWICSLVVIIFERDVGFSLLLFVVFVAMLWVTTGRWTYVLAGLGLFIVGTFVASHVLGQVDQRISVWLNPVTAGQAGYQSIAGQAAFGFGGVYGTGLGLGHAGTIPVAYSDMIFAAISEDLGLIGASAVIVGFLLIVGTGLRTALRARSEFAKLTAIGLTVVLGFQTFFIIAGVLRILPFTGITLPFVAYGGSSLIANYILVALLMRISDEGARPPELQAGVFPARSRTSAAAMMGTIRR